MCDSSKTNTELNYKTSDTLIESPILASSYLAQAIQFLTHPSVETASAKDKRQFLIDKGLTIQDVDAALQSHHITSFSLMSVLEAIILPLTTTLGIISLCHTFRSRYLSVASGTHSESNQFPSLRRHEEKESFLLNDATHPDSCIEPDIPKSQLSVNTDFSLINKDILHITHQLHDVQQELLQCQQQIQLLKHQHQADIDHIIANISDLEKLYHMTSSEQYKNNIRVPDKLIGVPTSASLETGVSVKDILDSMIQTPIFFKDTIKALETLQTVFRRMIHKFEDERFRSINLTSPIIDTGLGNKFIPFAVSIFKSIGMSQHGLCCYTIQNNETTQHAVEELLELLQDYLQQVSQPQSSTINQVTPAVMTDDNNSTESIKESSCHIHE